MEKIKEQLAKIDWQGCNDQLNDRGFVLVPGSLDLEQCDKLCALYDQPDLYRKTVQMERYRFGQGEYKYFDYPLPGMLEKLRETLYPKLAPTANLWMNALGIEKRFPDSFSELQAQCHAAGQHKPTVLILKYGPGGFNTLHQDLYGELFFPMQTLLFLNEPGEDYTGGEFVLTEQIPRAQSKAIVLTPRKGDLLIFTTNFRPVKGSKGYYRVNMKHGVSEITSGKRHTLGIIFHDALS